MVNSSVCCALCDDVGHVARYCIRTTVGRRRQAFLEERELYRLERARRKQELRISPYARAGAHR